MTGSVFPALSLPLELGEGSAAECSAAVGLALLLSGFGAPIPEDLTLIAAGYAVHRGLWTVSTAIPVGVLGVLVGDSIMFGLGRSLGRRALDRTIRHGWFPSKRVERARAAVRQRPLVTIVVSRFLPFVRGPIYFAAGSLGVRYSAFFLADLVAVILSVPLVITVSSSLGPRLEQVTVALRASRWIVAGGLATVGLMVIARRVRRSSPVDPASSPNP
ncbi:MAG: DedA family protein [Planctomycetes bacterium]|nr:DedA family protein [Planctomycetota bacterium]